MQLRNDKFEAPVNTMTASASTELIRALGDSTASHPRATKFGAIDIGTNSIHLVMAEISPQGDFKVLGREKDMVQLGKGGFGEHRLTDRAMDDGLQALRRFKKMAESQGVTKLRAVATSAVREASNGGEFVQRVRDELELRIQVISAEEEARLIYVGVRHAIDMGNSRDRQTLIVDIGGGSVELIAGNAQGITEKASVKLGGSRLAELFIRSDPPGTNEVSQMRRHIRSKLDPIIQRMRSLPIKQGIATSGSAKNLAIMCGYARGESNPEESRLRIFRGELQALRDRLTRMTREQRLRVDGMDAKRVDACIPASALLLRLMKRCNLEILEHCEFALREGVMIDYIARHREKLQARATWPNPRSRSVMHLAERCGFRKIHAEHVAMLAARLFDELQPIHGLDSTYKELLSYACLLHDIGHLISHDSHHKHSYYLVRNGSLKGFTDQEIEIIANIARYHRKERPKKSHFSFHNLDVDHRRPVRILAVLLRLADALDRTNFSIISDVKCDIGERAVTLRATTTSDAEIELWCAKRHAPLFEREFDRKLTVCLAGN
ncbi:MAG: Ppx/GppA family phosphatase [Phycisphaerales bacterium]|nr:Ppx/GppA family phosphatase [Phycisphaerales bacterium]MCB9856612.1 Ppx/GppA family phosphatase [Phycisphaerales bacterium]